MALYKNVIVPVPRNAQAILTTGRVYIIRERIYDSKRQYNVDKRITIGKLNSNTGETMNPNDTFADMFPKVFYEAAKGKEAPVTKRTGMYAFSLAIGYDTSLYPLLVDKLGPQNANFVMDFANYMILNKSNVAKDFEVLMKDHMLFSERLHSDSAISNYLEKLITREQIEDFKEKWVFEWLDKRPSGKRKVWACADGCNSNCEAKDVEYAEKGHAKSLKNINIYAYMHIIDAETGEEISYIIYRGGKIDAKAFSDLMAILRRYGLDLAGIILDRGFCTIDCFQLILDMKMSYVIMMPESTNGYKHMVQQYGADVKQIKNLCAPNIYAVEGRARVFKKYDFESKIILCYDNKNGPDRENYLVNHVIEAVQKANKEYAENPDKKPSIDDKWKKYIRINAQITPKKAKSTHASVLGKEVSKQGQQLSQGSAGNSASNDGKESQVKNASAGKNETSDKPDSAIEASQQSQEPPQNSTDKDENKQQVENTTADKNESSDHPGSAVEASQKSQRPPQNSVGKDENERQAKIATTDKNGSSDKPDSAVEASQQGQQPPQNSVDRGENEQQAGITSTDKDAASEKLGHSAETSQQQCQQPHQESVDGDRREKQVENTSAGKNEASNKEASQSQSSQLPIEQLSNPYCSINEEVLQKAVEEKGFSCMAVSDDISAELGVKLYDLRDKNEKLYMVIKSHLGSKVARVWYTNGVESKHLIVMVANIIRHKLEEACKKCGYVLTTAIRELNFLAIQRASDNVYFAVNNASSKQEELMAKFNISYSTLEDIAAKETNRVKKIGIPEQVHTIAREEPKTEEPKEDPPEEEPQPKRPGRPKGSTNKNNSSGTEEPKAKEPKKRGRPKGSKNKPKPEGEVKKEPGKRGRPKGSKNKKGSVNAKNKRAAKSEKKAVDA